MCEKKGDNSSKFCLVSSWEVNNLRIVAFRQQHTSVYHTHKIISGKCPGSLPVTKVSGTKRSESTKKLWLVQCLNCPHISQRSSNIQKFTQSEEWNVSQESKGSLLVLYRIWERKALNRFHLTAKNLFTIQLLKAAWAHSHRLIPVTPSLLFHVCIWLLLLDDSIDFWGVTLDHTDTTKMS